MVRPQRVKLVTDETVKLPTKVTARHTVEKNVNEILRSEQLTKNLTVKTVASTSDWGFD